MRAFALAAATAMAVPTTLAALPRARAYDFHVDATTTAQAYQVRWFRYPDPDVLLNRRRFTQALGLELWNLLAPRRDPGYPDRPAPRAPFELYFMSSMRVDHDFGAYTQGSIEYLAGAGVPVTHTAVDVVPELAAGNLALDVLYAYVGGRDALGFLDFALGRQVSADDLEWYAFDGLSLRASTPFHLALEAKGGLVVRERLDDALGTSAHEPDGTSTAQCAMWDEALLAWVAADECTQREEPMPTFGFGIATDRVPGLEARAAYRRTMSPTAEGIDPTDSHAWGTNEEYVLGSARGSLFDGGVTPFAAARFSLVLGQVDEAHAGLRVAVAEHALTAQVAYSFPSFDADSIFNVFGTTGYTDYRLDYDLRPGGRLRLGAHGFLRDFGTGADAGSADDAGDGEATSREWAAGGGASARLRLPAGQARLDLYYEDGFGGRIAGGDATARYRIARNLQAEGRITALHQDDDLRPDLAGVTLGAQGGALLVLSEEMGLHLLAEENTSPLHTSQFRVTLLLDLAFRPEI